MNGETEGRGELGGRIWLFLLKAGGRWVSRDAAKAMGETDKTAVSWQLSAMARCGHVRKFEVPGKPHRSLYGVTGDCKVPSTVTVSRIAECVLAAAPDSEEASA